MERKKEIQFFFLILNYPSKHFACSKNRNSFKDSFYSTTYVSKMNSLINQICNFILKRFETYSGIFYLSSANSILFTTTITISRILRLVTIEINYSNYLELMMTINLNELYQMCVQIKLILKSH